MVLPPDLVPTTLKFGAFGFGLFAVIGVLKCYNCKPAGEQRDILKDGDYIHLNQDEDVLENINRLRAYQKQAPEEFRALQSNMDKLMGLQISILQNKTQASFPYKATRFFVNIEKALRDMEYRLKKVAVAHFHTDKERFLKKANDYRHNITLGTNAFIMKQRS